MGVGRRMKKQGPPAPLDESKISSIKKRKASEAEWDERGKKRKASRKPRDFVRPGTVLNGATPKEANKSTNGHSADSKSSQTKKGTKPVSKALRAKNAKLSVKASDDDIVNPSEEDVNLENDDFNDLDSDLGGDNLPPDEFLSSDSSVYDSDPQHGQAMFSEDEGDSDGEEQLTAANIEGLSMHLDKEKENEAADAQLELEEAAIQTNIKEDRPAVLENVDGDDDDDLNTTTRLAPDLQLLRTRITDTVRVLDDFSKLSEEGRSRAEYTAQLLRDICLYYGYSPFLAEKLLNLFSPREAFAFFEANETARPVVIRTNTLRTHRRDLAQSLINRGVTLEPVGKWSKVGLQIFESQVPLGATPEYLAGHYILQAASSFLPVMALAPQENERILDMAAAPGGKTTYMAALMKNTGCIFANDGNKSRAKGLIGNIHRMGAKNTIVSNHDGREFPKIIGGFDRVLLDAPCSGTGVIAKDPSVKTNKTETDFLRLPHLQKQLLLAAIDSVDHASKTGGYVVYSTCSVTVEENEQVVQYALSKRPNVRIVETGLTFGVEGFSNYMGRSFDAKMKFARRFYPHKYNVDGFFVCKLRKAGPTPSAAATKGAISNGDHPNLAAGGNGEGIDRASIEGETEIPFGGFETDEDEKIIERAERRRLKRKGLDPKGRSRNANG